MKYAPQDKEYYQKRIEEGSEGIDYSIQRIDILTVAISGGGIYVCLETLKFLSENDINPTWIIKISGFLFLVSVVLNFVSQVYGRKAHEKDYLWSQTMIEFLDKPDSQELETEASDYETESENYSKKCNEFTDLSTLAMGIGLVCLVLYFVFIF